MPVPMKKQKLKKSKYPGRYYGQPWTLEEMTAIAATCKNRGEFYTKHSTVYMRAYQKNVLDQVCSVLPASQKKNKFIANCVLPANILAPAFSCKTIKEFRENHPSQYNAGRRFGIDFVELFDHIDDANYIKNLFQELYSKNTEKLVENATN